MSTDVTPPVTPPAPPPTVTTPDGRTLRLGEFDPDVGAHVYTDDSGKPWIPYSRFKESREEVKALKSKSSDPEAAKALRDQIRGELAQEYEQRVVEAQLEGALYRHGFEDDEETRGEVLSRYAQAKPDAEGKRPTLAAWLKAQREANDGAGARWLRSYLRADTPAAAKPATPATVEAPPAAPKPRPASDPNGGVTGKPAPPRSSFTNEEIAGMSFQDAVRNLATLRQQEGLPVKPGKA